MDNFSRFILIKESLSMFTLLAALDLFCLLWYDHFAKTLLEGYFNQFSWLIIIDFFTILPIFSIIFLKKTKLQVPNLWFHNSFYLMALWVQDMWLRFLCKLCIPLSVWFKTLRFLLPSMSNVIFCRCELCKLCFSM